MNLIEQNLKKLSKLCSTHNVLKLYVFGSIVTGNFNSKSDLIELKALKNPYLKKSIDVTKRIIYGY